MPKPVWEVGVSRLPLGTPVVRLTVAGATVFMPPAVATDIAGALTAAAQGVPK